MNKNFLVIILVTLSLISIVKAEALTSRKSIKIEKGKTYHCDGNLSKIRLDLPMTEPFKCELMRKDKHRHAPFEYITTKQIVNLRCPKGLSISSEPQYDEGYIYKYLVNCKEPMGED